MPSLFSASRATSIVLSAASSFGGSTSTVVFAIAVNLIGLIREKSSLTTVWTRQLRFCGKTAIVFSSAPSTSLRIENYRYWNIWKTSKSDNSTVGMTVSTKTNSFFRPLLFSILLPAGAFFKSYTHPLEENPKSNRLDVKSCLMVWERPAQTFSSNQTCPLNTFTPQESK